MYFLFYPDVICLHSPGGGDVRLFAAGGRHPFSDVVHRLPEKDAPHHGNHGNQQQQ